MGECVIFTGHCGLSIDRVEYFLLIQCDLMLEKKRIVQILQNDIGFEVFALFFYPVTSTFSAGERYSALSIIATKHRIQTPENSG